MIDKEYEEFLYEKRPTCSCGEKMIVVLYVGFKQKIKFFHCDNCELDPFMYHADDTWYETEVDVEGDLGKLLEHESERMQKFNSEQIALHEKNKTEEDLNGSVSK